MIVLAQFSYHSRVERVFRFDWNNRAEVRRFAALADEWLRLGYGYSVATSTQ